jgi:N-formylglutamate amidohydrolase
VTKHYGKPYESANALQIEINRDLYLNPITLDKKPGFTALARNISLIINSIIKEVTALNL